MAITNSLVTNGDAANVYISVGASAITAMYLCNTDSSARTFDIYVCPAGNSLTTLSQRVYSGIQVQTGDTYVVDSEKLILSAGDMIKANTDATNAISMTISYIGI
tara:strand:+ start:266 stop:580 length:315 start_codon:yes stop_codon:yes gene_type:complete